MVSLVVVKSLSCVQLFATPWTAVCQASLSFTISWSLLKPMSISWWCHPTISSSVIPFSSCLQFFQASGSLPIRCQSIWASASASVLPMNIQGWFPWGLTGLISLQSKGLSRVYVLQSMGSKRGGHDLATEQQPGCMTCQVDCGLDFILHSPPWLGIPVQCTACKLGRFQTNNLTNKYRSTSKNRCYKEKCRIFL